MIFIFHLKCRIISVSHHSLFILLSFISVNNAFISKSSVGEESCIHNVGDVGEKSWYVPLKFLFTVIIIFLPRRYLITITSYLIVFLTPNANTISISHTSPSCLLAARSNGTFSCFRNWGKVGSYSWYVSYSYFISNAISFAFLTILFSFYSRSFLSTMPSSPNQVLVTMHAHLIVEMLEGSLGTYL